MKRLLKVTLGIAGVLVLTLGGLLVYIERSGIPHYAPGTIELKVDVTPARVEKRLRPSLRLFMSGRSIGERPG